MTAISNTFISAMGDPLSATGTAVGIVSLGIQVCKGLIWYLDNVKDAKDKATQMMKEVDHLANILEILEGVISKVDMTPAVSMTRTGIVECATAIEKIRDKLGLVTRGNHSGIRAYFHDVKGRLSYPCKQDDIIYWKGVLDHIQQSLQTALLALQM